MTGIKTHLVRRAVEGYGAIRTAGVPPRVADALKDIHNFTLPAWFVIASTVTLFIFLAFAAAVDYSLGGVVATLLMVESPPQDVVDAPPPPQYEDMDDVDAPLLSQSEKLDAKLASAVPELRPTRQAAPITYSIRGTFRHLRSRGGRFAKYRGLRLNFLTHIVASHLSHMVLSMLPRAKPITQYLAPAVATVLVAPLLLTWTHVVISEPSPKFWFRRIPNFRTIVKVLPATAVFAAATQLVIFLPTTLIQTFGLHRVGRDLEHAEPMDRQEIISVACAQIVVILAVTVFASAMILIPADVTLTRVQASLLPESDETIVPMDRSFGGKVVSEQVGGTGKLGLLDAWRSFRWASRVRLVLLYAKIFFIQMALLATFVTIFAFEASIALRPIMCKSHMVAEAFMRGDIRPEQL